LFYLIFFKIIINKKAAYAAFLFTDYMFLNFIIDLQVYYRSAIL